MRAIVLLLLFVSCKSKHPHVASPSFSAPFPAPADFVACKVDADCVVISLGCAHPTPVNRAHADETGTWMLESNWELAPPKGACGDAPDTPSGTWDGYPGVCQAGTCRIPKVR